MTNGERHKIFKEWFNSIGFPEMHSSYKDAMWQGFEAGHRKASKINDAAPKLLEALQFINNAINHGTQMDIVKGQEMAEAAINKALGE